jgi:TRAP-type C4-dicarboxylate transport system substrate-binding protein
VVRGDARRSLVLVALLSASQASAEPKYVLRMAAVPPEGTSYARETKAFVHDVDQLSRGELQVRFYMGGIAGDELEVGRRIERGQLDGTASAGMLCQRLAPSWRVLRVLGLFLDRAELDYIIGRLSPKFVEEFKKSGAIFLGGASMGPTMVFSKVPVSDIEALKKLRLWRWSLDDVPIEMGKHMGLRQVALPLDQAVSGFEEGRTDGYISIPVAALAFGFHAHVSHVLEMPLDYLAGCIMVSERSFDRLPMELREVVRTAAAKMAQRVSVIGEQEEHKLLGDVFTNHGVRVDKPEPQLRTDYLELARTARDQLPDSVASRATLQQVQEWLADYRATHARH